MSARFKLVLPFCLMAVLLLCVESAMGQRGGRGGDRGGLNFMRGGGNNMIGLLASEQIQKELELDENQLQDMKDLQEELQQTMRDMFSGLQDIPREERQQRFAKLGEDMQAKTKEIEEELTKRVLLPHQVDRLKQLSFQSSGRGRGAGGALQNEALLDELGLSEKQKEELEEAVDKAREDLQKKYQALVKDAEQDILKVLTREQREKYKELVGEAFEFENRRGGFQQFGQQRGRGRGGNDRND